MDYKQAFNSIVDNSLSGYDFYKLHPPNVLLELTSIPTPEELRAAAVDVVMWLFSNKVWDEQQYTRTIAHPLDSEASLVLFPLTGALPINAARKRVKYSLDSSAQIWTRARNGTLEARTAGDFDDENEIGHLIRLLQAVDSGSFAS